MNSIDNYVIALNYLSPEFCLVAGIIVAALWNLFVPNGKQWTPRFSLVALVLAIAFLAAQFRIVQPTPLFGGIFTLDALTVMFGLVACSVSFIVVLMTTGYEHHFGKNVGEFYTILLTATLAVMLLAGSTDLVMLFVSLETLSICCVLLAGFTKKDRRSGEASLKYLLSTAATTATLLYGLSFIYGLTGSTSYGAIAEKLVQLAPGVASLIKIFLMVLVLSAVGFKLSAVPFHMWTPDVYEGAPTPVTAFLSIGSKAGGFVMALRLLMVLFGSASADWTLILSALAILSMIAGNLIALAQTDFKRMLAYSSIAHVGYILIGLIANSYLGLSALMFYIIIYGVMNLGAFAAAIAFSNITGSDKIDDFAGLFRKRPWLALGLSVCLLNLAGLPLPPAGFFAKVFIFTAGMQIPAVNSIPLGALLVGIGLLTSVPAIFYYTRVVIKMIVAEPSVVVAQLPSQEKIFGSPQLGPITALTMCVIAILGAGTKWVDPVMNASRDAIAPIIPVTEHRIPVSQLRNSLN